MINSCHINLLRFYRVVRKISQEELAAEIGCSQGWMSQVEREYYKPNSKDIARLAAALGVDPSSLEDGEAS